MVVIQGKAIACGYIEVFVTVLEVIKEEIYLLVASNISIFWRSVILNSNALEALEVEGGRWKSKSHYKSCLMRRDDVVASS
jgi:hypothetical protein